MYEHPESLDAEPVGKIVYDVDGMSWQKHQLGFWISEEGTQFFAHDMIEYYGPITERP